MTPYPLRSNGKWLRVRYGAIMTPYQMICGSPFKMVVNLDFWHLWVFFLLVLKKFRGWQNPSKKVKVRLLSDFFWKIKLYQLCHFPFCSNWSLSLFNFHESFSFMLTLIDYTSKLCVSSATWQLEVMLLWECTKRSVTNLFKMLKIGYDKDDLLSSNWQ